MFSGKPEEVIEVSLMLTFDQVFMADGYTNGREREDCILERSLFALKQAVHRMLNGQAARIVSYRIVS